MTRHVTPRLPRHLVAVACLLGAAVGYTLAVDPVVHSPGQVLYPVVWVGASGAFLWSVREGLSSVGGRALAVGGLYTLVLLWTAGLVGHSHASAGVSIHLGAPGWGPALLYAGPVVYITAVPFLLVGYAALGLLAAAALQTALRTTLAGAVGLLACVSCAAPLLAGLAGSLGAGTVATSVSTAQYPLATAAFLLSGAALTVLARSAS